MRREVQDHAAADEQADNDGVSEGAALPQNETRNAIHVFDLLFSLRRNLVEEVEIDAVDDRQQHGVEHRQRALPPDDEEVSDADEQEDDLDGVLAFKLDLAQTLAALPAMECSGGHINHRPAEADEQAQAAGEVGRHQRGGVLNLKGVRAGAYGLSRLPGDDRLDGKFGQRLQPGQDGQRQTLRDEKLRRFGGPGDQHRRAEHGRERPQRRGRAGSCRSRLLRESDN